MGLLSILGGLDIFITNVWWNIPLSYNSHTFSFFPGQWCKHSSTGITIERDTRSAGCRLMPYHGLLSASALVVEQVYTRDLKSRDSGHAGPTPAGCIKDTYSKFFNFLGENKVCKTFKVGSIPILCVLILQSIRIGEDAALNTVELNGFGGSNPSLCA